VSKELAPSHDLGSAKISRATAPALRRWQLGRDGHSLCVQGIRRRATVVTGQTHPGQQLRTNCRSRYRVLVRWRSSVLPTNPCGMKYSDLNINSTSIRGKVG
jgi:hypothetical protein